MTKTKRKQTRIHRVLNLTAETQVSLHKLLKFMIRSEGFPPNLEKTEVGLLNDLGTYLEYRMQKETRENKNYESLRNQLIPEAERLANKKVRGRGFDASEQLIKQDFWSKEFLLAMDELAHKHLGVSCSWIEEERWKKYVGDGHTETDREMGRRADSEELGVSSLRTA